jgi:hypothetical protein
MTRVLIYFYFSVQLCLMLLFFSLLFQEFLLMFMWYGIGFTLYITRMPEKLFPNR